MDSQKLLEFVSKKWDETIIPTLSEYISIPNQSPAFDKDWETNGLVDKVVELLVNWVKNQNVENLHVEVWELKSEINLFQKKKAKKLFNILKNLLFETLKLYA